MRTPPLARAALVAALVALPAASARAGAPSVPAPPPPAATPPPPGAERLDVEVRFPPWQYAGTFRLRSASGAIVDEGVARDGGGIALSGAPVERVLEGAKGTLVLHVRGGVKTSGFPPIFGRWTVVRGTGAYARLAGGGTFTACAMGESGKGSPFELQTMLGHLHPR